MRKRLPVFGWALYDFANTIFSMNVISLYFVLWVTVDKGREDIFYSITLSGSLLMAALLEPFLGAVSDIFKRKIPFLVFFTVLACAFTAFLGLAKDVFSGLLIFFMANLFYQVATIFYNAMLPRICGHNEIGRVSGLGTGFGYVGAIVGMLITRPFVIRYGHQAAFVPTAVLFFIFSLPCFFLVREESAVKRPADKFRMGNVVSRIKETFSNRDRYPGLLLFLLGAFLFLNAVNTLIVFMSVYMKKVALFSDSELIALFLFSTVMAIFGSLFFGFMADRLGAKRSLMISLFLWFVCLVLAACAFSRIMFWIVGPLIGVALGSVWTTSRALAVKLCPEEKLGEIFGLLGLVGKSSAILGPLIWGLSILVFGFMGASKYRVAMLIQTVFIIAGILITRKVPEGNNR
ncbi:MAG: MFS transporter [Candidatus Omnitrophota bacterium]|nr:MFS transporter [Candidatus Omnitrophota bacterium]